MFKLSIATRVVGFPAAAAQIVGIRQNGVEPSGRLTPYNILSAGLLISAPCRVDGSRAHWAVSNSIPAAKGTDCDVAILLAHLAVARARRLFLS
jgi:hypothetical protein